MATDPTTLWEVLNSEFVMSLTGALAGAFGGAYAAQHIAERSKVREEVLKELRNINAAITLAYAVTNTFINIKMQHVKRLFDTFNDNKATLLEIEKKRKPSERPTFEFRADLQIISPAKVPIQQLQKILFERINAPTRAMSLIEVLDRTVDGFNTFVIMRNELIETFKQKGMDPLVYFGLPTPAGTDGSYATTLKGIYDYTDDCIYFSMLLAKDLTKYAQILKARLSPQMRAVVPIIVTGNFAKGEDMIPPASNYPDWDTMFKYPPRPTFWERMGWAP